MTSLLTHPDAWVASSMTSVTLSVCLRVCPRSKRKTTRAINTKLSTRKYTPRQHLGIIDPKVKRSKVNVTWLMVMKTVTVERLLVKCAAAAAGVGL